MGLCTLLGAQSHFFSADIGDKIKTAGNGVCFYLYKFALQTFLSYCSFSLCYEIAIKS